MNIKYFGFYKKILNYFLLIILLSTFFYTLLAFACVSSDSRVSVVIGNLNIDFEKLQNICSIDTCIYFEDSVILKSSCNDKVAIIISPGFPRSPGFPFQSFINNTVTVKLPYQITEIIEGYEIIEEDINPENFDWKGCVMKELENLRNAKILSIKEEEIEIISRLAEPHKNIIFCNNSWKKLNANCNCEGCVRCIAKPIPITLPNKVLFTSNYSEINNEVNATNENKETKFILFLLVLVIIFCVVVAIILFFTRIPSYE